MSEVAWRDLYGLYAEGWGDRIVPEAFAHFGVDTSCGM